jgi:hypothetical protein
MRARAVGDRAVATTWLKGEVAAGRLTPEPTVEQLATIAGILRSSTKVVVSKNEPRALTAPGARKEARHDLAARSI